MPAGEPGRGHPGQHRAEGALALGGRRAGSRLQDEPDGVLLEQVGRWAHPGRRGRRRRGNGRRRPAGRRRRGRRCSRGRRARRTPTQRRARPDAGVEVVAEGTRARKGVRVQAPPQHPCVQRKPVGLGPQGRAHLDGRRARGQVDAPGVVDAEQGVGVPVDEPGQQGAPGEVEDLAARASLGEDLAHLADAGDQAAANRDGVGRRPSRIERTHPGPHDDQVGGHTRLPTPMSTRDAPPGGGPGRTRSIPPSVGGRVEDGQCRIRVPGRGVIRRG